MFFYGKTSFDKIEVVLIISETAIIRETSSVDRSISTGFYSSAAGAANFEYPLDAKIRSIKSTE